MSVTVRDLLKLPSLRSADVIAGEAGLDQMVLTVSVVECTEATDTLDYLCQNLEYQGSELAITSFYGIRNDVEAQLRLLQRLRPLGIVGCVLFYVGVVLPKVDEKLIALADEMEFPLICMPVGNATLRYGEVISEVMEVVIREQMNARSFAVELLNQISTLPIAQRTVQTMLFLVSNRLHASVFITDRDGQLLHQSTWPRNLEADWEEVKSLNRQQGMQKVIRGESTIYCYREVLKPFSARGMEIFIVSEGHRPESHLLTQTVEAVILGLNLWSEEHARLGLRELVRAIIRDEPVLMRRIADLYGLDMTAVNDMIILHGTKEDLSKYEKEARETAKGYFPVTICESYDKDILLFISGNPALSEIRECSQALHALFAAKKKNVYLTECLRLKSTKEVKEAYFRNGRYLEDACRIFPGKGIFSLSEINFVRDCRKIAEEGEEQVEKILTCLDPLRAEKESAELLETLSVYYLDRSGSVTETAKHLFVHKNTVKYRLKKVGELLGFSVGDQLSSRNLCFALALLRMLRY